MIRSKPRGPAALALATAICLAAIGPAAAQTGAATDAAVEYQMRSSDLVGKTVSNRLDQKIGTIDNLLIGRDGRIEYAVVGVGGFLGVGEKLVAVPYTELKIEGDAVLLDRTAEQLKALPGFKYRQQAAIAPGGRERYLEEGDKRMSDWERRISEWRQGAKERSREAGDRLDRAWEGAKQKWSELKDTGAEGWERARQNFERAWGDMEQAWRDATS